MLENLIFWIGGGLAIVIAYVIVSNTLWLLFGSTLLQRLPGVQIKGFRGTLKIAIMLFLSVTGFMFWIIKFFSCSLYERIQNQNSLMKFLKKFNGELN